MAYISLYRKYRSQTFEDVVGQEHVTKTLQNAIRLGKVAHAYLFCGTRGTGKTTSARLLAKALCCKSGPTPYPCNQCTSCISITEGSAMDIIELDAASHRGVQDIKDIRENVKFPPMELRYKVFIIDEAHQLSNDAKDAFLKTLEEPPAHAVFILATTEPQSIPITIRSRCQQFEFRRGSLRDIRGRLKYIADSEGVEIDDLAVELVAVNADGSYRDSLSLLEQVLAYTETRVTVEDVNTVLGTVTQDFRFRLADVIASGDDREAFSAAQEVMESGKDVQLLLRSMAQHFRDLLFAAVSRNVSSLAASEETAARLKEQSGRFDKQGLLRIVEVFTETERESRFSEQHRLLLELALLKAIELASGVQAPAMVSPPAPERPAAQSSAPAPTAPPPSAQQRPSPRPEVQPARTSPPAAPPKPPAQTEAPIQAGKQSLPEFDRIVQKWTQIMQLVKTTSIPAYALLSNVTAGGLRDGSIVLHFEHESHVGLFSRDDAKKKALQTAFQKVFGVQGVGIICEKAPEHKAPAQAAPAPVQAEDPIEPLQTSDQGTLRDLLDIFPNAEIVDD